MVAVPLETGYSRNLPRDGENGTQELRDGMESSNS